MEFLKNNKDTILLCILIFFMVLSLIDSQNIKTDIKKYKNEIKLIQTKIDSTQKLNENINKNIVNVSNKIFGVYNQIDSIEIRIKNLKKNETNKIIIVDTLNSDQLQKFFSDRYK